MVHKEFNGIDVQGAKKSLEQLAENRLFSPTELDKRSTDRHAEDFINSLDLSYAQVENLKKYYEEAKTRAVEASL